MTAKNSKPSEEEVVLAFSSESMCDRKTLERYLDEYPEYAKAIVDCSIELIASATRHQEAPVESDTSIDKAWQRFQAAVGMPKGEELINPFAKLNPTAFKTLAKNLDINNLLLIRLRDRAIDAATIPRRFVQKLAAALGSDAEVVKAYLQNPPGIVSAHSFRSSVKPGVTEQISFEKAVETSQLTQTQQDALRLLGD